MNELLPLATRIGGLLKERRETVALAESTTGGLLSAALLSVPGASKYFLGGAVIYTKKSRELLLDLPGDPPAGMRSSTEPYALFLAGAVRGRFAATWGIGETGAAGPAGNKHGDKAGHSCIAVSGPLDAAITVETGNPDRVMNMRAFSLAALELLAKSLAR